MLYADAEKTFVIEDNVEVIADLPMAIVEELLLKNMFPKPILDAPRVWRVQEVRKWRARVLGAAAGRLPGKKRGPYGPRVQKAA